MVNHSFLSNNVCYCFQKDTCKLRFDKRRVELRHKRCATVYVHDIDNIVSDVTFPFYLLTNEYSTYIDTANNFGSC